MKFPSNIINVIVILSLVFIYAQSQTPPFWDKSALMKTGVYNLVSSLTSFTNRTGSVTYNTAMINTTKLRFFTLGLIEYQNKQYSSFYIDYWLQDYTNSATGFSFFIYSRYSTQILTLTFAFFTADYVVPADCLNAGMFWINETSFQSGTTLTQYVDYQSLSNQTFIVGHDYCIQAYNNILYAQSSVATNFVINSSLSQINTTHYKVSITIPSTMGIKQWGFTRLVIDKTQLLANQIYNCTCGLFTLNNVTSGTLSIPILDKSSWMFGMFSYSPLSYNFTNFFAAAAPTQFSVTLGNPYEFISFHYAVLQQRQCPSNEPYLKTQANGTLLCYSDCGFRYYKKNTTRIWTCEPCHYTCYQCTSNTSTTCTNCSSSDNRQLVSTSCPPIPTYYDNGTSVAVPCPTGCSTCVNDTKCNICLAGYNLVSNLCKCVLSNCDVCTSSTVCTTCSAGYYVNSSNQCSLCNTTMSNCTTCQNSVNCLTCQNGFFLNGTNLCQACISQIQFCLQCSSSTDCTLCQIGYQVIEGFCSKIVCQNGCNLCSSASVCVQCLQTFYLSGSSCLLCQSAMTGCELCNSSSSCQNCYNSHYLSGSTCVLCSSSMTNCLNCTSSSVCINCQAGYMINSTNQCTPSPCDAANCDLCSSNDPNVCITCSLGYQLGQTGQCNQISCFTQCQVCLSTTQCDTCFAGYYLSAVKDCLACNSSISNCVQCSGSSVCTLCQIQFYISASFLCNLCLDNIPNCLQCSSSTICQLCQPGYQVNNLTSLCDQIPCNVTNCNTCQSVDKNQCEICQNGYILTQTNQCEIIPCSSPCSLCSSSMMSTPCYFCLDGFYLDTSSQTSTSEYPCLACSQAIINCVTCSDSATCTKCSIGNYLSGGICFSCPIGCLQCDSASICTVCDSGYYLNSSSSCQSCSSYDQNCTLCDSSVCTKCIARYRVVIPNNLTCQLIPCIVSNCQTCVTNDINHCLICLQGYQVSSQQLCQTHCGDGIRINLSEQCDDGNNDNMDGCSQICLIQSGFFCKQPAPPSIPLSDCTYTLPIDFNINFIEKVQGANQVKAQISISPLLKAFQNFNFSSLISTDLPASQYSFSYNKQTGVLDMIISYTQSIQNFQATVTINPPNSGIFRLTPSASQRIVMSSRDNAGLNFYSDQNYQLAKIVQQISLVLPIVAWIFFIFGLFIGKMIVVQMFAVFQISFFGLMIVSQMNPTLEALKNLFISNGFNRFLVSDSYQSGSFPIPFKGIIMTPYQVYNFNVSLVLVLIPLIIALITFIISKVAFKQAPDKQQILSKIYTSCTFQYTFLMIIISGYLISVSIVLQFIYGFSSLSNIVGYISIPQCVIVLVLLITYFILLLKFPEYFGQFKEQFDQHSNISCLTYNYMMIQRLIIGSLLVGLYFISFILVAPIVIFTIEGVFFLVKKPYKKIKHCIRQTINNLIAIIILSIYVYYGFDPHTSSTSQISLYLPLVILALLAVCLIMNAVFIIKKFIIWIKLQCNKSNNKKEVELEMSNMKPFRQYNDISQFPPSPAINLRQQNINFMNPNIQKLQHKDSIDYLQEISNQMNNIEFYPDQLSLDVKQIQQQNKNVQNILGNLNDIKKNQTKQQVSLEQDSPVRTNLLDFEDL